MGSDRARGTYDEAKQYRRVVQQQGRVVLEADTNEAQEIFAEETRREVIDLVGPVGLPAGSDGYAIGFVSPGQANSDLTIGQGTFYLGGFRVHQGVAGLTYTTQNAHDWVDGPAAAPDSNLELVYLRVREHEVSAVEDGTLLDPALGGPDTAQRVRLVRRVERYATASDQAATAFSDLKATWATQGIAFDKTDMRLLRSARLAVSLGGAGYLGPDNQMIRVQIASAGGTPPTNILWAYDDASALYLVDTTSGSATNLGKYTLQITPLPVDAAHQPIAGQYVEILVAAASLGGTDYVAATCGYVTTVESADPGAGTIIVAGLPPDAAKASALFVRVWENSQAFTLGTPLELMDRANNDTGIAVTLSGLDAGGPVPGDYWSFAVRTAYPTDVYPTRYSDPQPPEGPREWACPLALVDWTTPSAVDVRPPFVTLTSSSAGGCCTVTVSPKDVGGSFEAILARYKNTGPQKKRVTICLQPGRYTLTEPLRLGRDHSGLTIESCCERAVLEAAQGAEAAFLDGMIVLTHAHDVTLRGLSFRPPSAAGPNDGDAGLSIAVRPLGCAGLSVRECAFNFDDPGEGPLLGAGIFAGGHCQGLHVMGCTFRAEGPSRAGRVLFGYLHMPSFPAGGRTPDAKAAEVRRVEATLVSAWFRHNIFSGLTAAVLASGRLGEIGIDGNRVHGGDGGFWFLDSGAAAQTPQADVEEAFNEQAVQQFIRRAHGQRVPVEFIVEDAPPAVTLRLHVADNTIEMVRDPSGSALLVRAAGAELGGTAIVSANRMINASRKDPTAALERLYAASITGNVIMNYGNDREERWSLRLTPERWPGLYAVTGNVLVGKDDLHAPWPTMNEHRP